jgi:hypothetical protein
MFLTRRFRREREDTRNYHLTRCYRTQSQPWVLDEQVFNAPALKLTSRRLSHSDPMVLELMGSKAREPLLRPSMDE